jgi:bifunctional DNA-binding transcriptional regulator/antitoxin component of YhaV-PrlF toxin-antitoxin module
VKITNKGQVTIPQTMRKKHGFVANAEIRLVDQPDGILITRVKHNRGKGVIATLMRGGKIKGCTEELLRLTRGAR